jgi:lipid-A-disaccharide synthase
MMIAGEASGDLHGSGVVRELKQRRPAIDIFGLGGDAMKREGMELVRHISSMSFMGFIEIVKHLGLIREIERTLESLLDQRTPDVVVLIDYPGFNLRFARKVKKRGINVLYYISPQVWAWRPGRVKTMKRLVDRMEVVFPFEVEWYRREGIDGEWVGHPLVETLRVSVSREEFFRTQGLDAGRRVVGLFPGSRKQELENMLPAMLDAARALKKSHNVQCALAVAPNLGLPVLREYVSAAEPIALVAGATYELMAYADAAIVTSGTATLETGWFGTPMVVIYKTSLPSYLIGRALITTRNIALVNIVLGKTVVPELIQNRLRGDAVANAVARILDDEPYRTSVRAELSAVRSKLGTPGASARVAEAIIALGEAA